MIVVTRYICAKNILTGTFSKYVSLFMHAVSFESKENLQSLHDTYICTSGANFFLLPTQWTLHQQKTQGNNRHPYYWGDWGQASRAWLLSLNHPWPSRMSEYQRVTCDDHDTWLHVCTWSLVFSWAANWLQKYRAVLWCFSSQLLILRNNISSCYLDMWTSLITYATLYLRSMQRLRAKRKWVSAYMSTGIFSDQLPLQIQTACKFLQVEAWWQMWTYPDVESYWISTSNPKE